MHFGWFPKPPGILSWPPSLDCELQEGTSHESGDWCWTLGVEAEFSQPLAKQVVNELWVNFTGWRETARGEEGFPGLRSLCPKGKYPVEEAAQDPQLRLSQWRKGARGSQNGSVSPFVHPSERMPACNMPPGAVRASRGPSGSQEHIVKDCRVIYETQVGLMGPDEDKLPSPRCSTRAPVRSVASD